MKARTVPREPLVPGEQAPTVTPIWSCCESPEHTENERVRSYTLRLWQILFLVEMLLINMRLSPFHTYPVGGEWFEDAPLYGRRGINCTYEILPIPPGEDVSDYQRIPRDADDLNDVDPDFDIRSARIGTDYVESYSTGPRPSIKFFSIREFKSQFFYDPLNPPKPRNVPDHDWQKLHESRVRGGYSAPPIHNTADRVTLLERIARLWNGEQVCGVHLLWDQCPNIKELTTDLDHDDINRLYYDTNLGHEFLRTFADANWFNATAGFLKSTSLFRKTVWSDLTQAGRTRINNDPRLSSLNGDLNEGLTHRVTVGLTVLEEQLANRDVWPYEEIDGDIVDVVSKDNAGRRYAIEILTDHHGWENYRRTYRKLRALDQAGFQPIVMFDTRDTAYKVFNFLYRDGLAELPNGPFNSEFSIERGREHIQSAYRDLGTDWAISNWSTTWKLWSKTIGPNGPGLTEKDVLSTTW